MMNGRARIREKCVGDPWIALARIQNTLRHPPGLAARDITAELKRPIDYFAQMRRRGAIKYPKQNDT